MIFKKLNKRGGTFGAWIEAIIFIVLFVAAFTIIGNNMNTTYNKNYDTSFGLGINNTLDSLKSYQGNIDNSTKGDSSFNSQGWLVLTTLPAIIKTTLTLIWSFITGGFINSIVGIMGLGEYSIYVIILFRILYFVAIGFILLKILTKVVI